MPAISRFLGIVITMYAGDHPPPHFEPLAVLAGTLPPRVLGQVFEWAALHQGELLADWDLVTAHQVPAPIPPLA